MQLGPQELALVVGWLDLVAQALDIPQHVLAARIVLDILCGGQVEVEDGPGLARDAVFEGLPAAIDANYLPGERVE